MAVHGFAISRSDLLTLLGGKGRIHSWGQRSLGEVGAAVGQVCPGMRPFPVWPQQSVSFTRASHAAPALVACRRAEPGGRQGRRQRRRGTPGVTSSPSQPEVFRRPLEPLCQVAERSPQALKPAPGAAQSTQRFCSSREVGDARPALPMDQAGDWEARCGTLRPCQVLGDGWGQKPGSAGSCSVPGLPC